MLGTNAFVLFVTSSLFTSKYVFDDQLGLRNLPYWNGLFHLISHQNNCFFFPYERILLNVILFE